MISQLGSNSDPAIDLDRFSISLFSGFRVSRFVREPSQLAQRLGGFRQSTALLGDPRRFLVVPFGLVPVPPFLVHPSELLPRGCFEVVLLQALKQLQRSLLMRQRRFEISSRQGERAEMTPIDALSAEVAS